MTFSAILEHLKNGGQAARAGWNGKGMWIRYIDLYNDKEFALLEAEGARGTWAPFIVMKTVDNKLVPWLASQTDLLANDWTYIS